MASSISVAMSGRVAWFWRFGQRDSGGTQKTRSAVYSSRDSSRLSSCLPVMPSFVSSALQLVAAGLEAVGDVLEEEQAEDDVLVLGGVDLAAEGVGGLPEGVGAGEVKWRLLLSATNCDLRYYAKTVPPEQSHFQWPIFYDAPIARILN